MLKHKNITLLKAYLSGNHAQLRFRKLRPMTYIGEVRHEKLLTSNNLTHIEARALNWKKRQDILQETEVHGKYHGKT